MTNLEDPTNHQSPTPHSQSPTPNPRPAARPFTMDGHQDAVLYAGEHGGPAAFDAGWTGAQLDLPGLRAGQVDASFWAIFAPGEAREPHAPDVCADEVDAQMARYHAWIDTNPAYRLLRSGAELGALAAEATGGDGAVAPFGVLLHCEGARGIRGLAHLQALHEQGLRSMGLTWNGANDYATGAKGDADRGLTAAGKDLVRELHRLHMVVDGAHLNRRGLWDLLELSSGPVVVTHTACAALHRDPRNLEDDQIRAIAASGGTIGIFYASIFLAAPGTPVTLETVLAHYDHLLDLVGPEHVALGSDFGGISSGLPAGLEHVATLPRLYAAFAARGYAPDTVAGLRGGNYLRVLSAILH